MMEFSVFKSMFGTAVKIVLDKLLGKLIDNALASDKQVERPLSASPDTNNYAQEVGGKIHYIRESLLGFSKRQMCEKLNIENVTQLERYESGFEEIPIHITRLIEKEYGVDPNYLDGKTSVVFTRFPIDKDVMINYLKEGFSPVIVTIPRSIDDNKDLYCYITFERYESDFVRISVGSLLCSFASSGGGRLNLQTLIDAMLDLNIPFNKAQVLMVNCFSWAAIQSGTYASETSRRGSRFADFDCSDIWEEWYKQTSVSRQRWEKMTKDSIAECYLHSQTEKLSAKTPYAAINGIQR